MEYSIGAHRKKELEDKILKFNKKAEKLGLPGVTVVFGNLRLEKCNGYMYEWVDVAVYGEPLRVDGWKLIAALQHVNGSAVVFRPLQAENEIEISC